MRALSSPARSSAYAFARLHWPGRSVALVLLLSTMMLPAQVTMIPSFLIWRGLGWYNTLNPLWVPAWFGSAFFIFLMVQHMKTIPKELEEAARIDGLNVVQTWWYVIVPQLKAHAGRDRHHELSRRVERVHGPADLPARPVEIPAQPRALRHAHRSMRPDWSMLMAGNMLMTLPSISSSSSSSGTSSRG